MKSWTTGNGSRGYGRNCLGWICRTESKGAETRKRNGKTGKPGRIPRVGSSGFVLAHNRRHGEGESSPGTPSPGTMNLHPPFTRILPGQFKTRMLSAAAAVGLL